MGTKRAKSRESLRHQATKDAWYWLNRGDGRWLSPAQRASIRLRLQDIDQHLIAWDKERAVS